MKHLVNDILSAIERAKNDAVSRKPDNDREAAYVFGFLQGKYQGLNEARLILEAFLNAEDSKEEYR